MSVHFYNTRGWMVGIDSHKFQMAVPPDPAPVPIPFFPYFAGVPLSWGICDPKSIVRTVTANGAPVLQKGHKKKMVPHVFVPCALPHPFQAVQGAAVIAKARTVCVMAVSSVTGGGASLATCLAGGWGLNANCFDPVPAPSGNVINPNTVQTTPSSADYVNAAIDLALSIVEKLLPKPISTVYKGLKGVDAVLKYLFKRFPRAPDSPAPVLLSDYLDDLTRRREDFIRKLLAEAR